MQFPAALLVASLGAIIVMLMLHVYIFIYDRRPFLCLWFIGWIMIAVNYVLDAFFPDVLRQNRLVLFLSLGSFFIANYLIFWGTLQFLKVKTGIRQFLAAGIIWLLAYVLLGMRIWSDLQMIRYTYLAVFAFSFWVSLSMIKSVRRYGKLVCFLGFLNIAWIANTVLFTEILKMPQMAPYIVSHIILICNAIGLIQLVFKEQKDEIERGLSHITYMNSHDELTGLYNKTRFDKKILELQTRSDCLPISLLFGDMNGLKFVNDVFGHQEGDHYLQKMAHIIRQSCRKTDMIARWGGDEFAIILPNTDKETAWNIGHRINLACAQNKGTDALLSISIGIATKSDAATELTKVLKEAEERMYEMKLLEGKIVRRSIADTLMRLLQDKGYESREHTERLEAVARKLARALCLTKDNLDHLVQAIRLHDIGKIGIPEVIVLKKSSLEEDEWTMMKRHVEIGYRIAHASGEFAYLADIILYHHEWWNGQGYPRGLTKEEIPLLSRIISILDAFDVMTNQQPYKSAKTADEALLELNEKAGVQFDPLLVSAFTEMMKKPGNTPG